MSKPKLVDFNLLENSILFIEEKEEFFNHLDSQKFEFLKDEILKDLFRDLGFEILIFCRSSDHFWTNYKIKTILEMFVQVFQNYSNSLFGTIFEAAEFVYELALIHSVQVRFFF